MRTCVVVVLAPALSMPKVNAGAGKNGMVKRCALHSLPTPPWQSPPRTQTTPFNPRMREANFSPPADCFVAMQKRTSLSLLLLVALAVLGSHISWVSRDNGTLLVVDGLEFDLAGFASNQWTQLSRNCSGVLRLQPGEAKFAMAHSLISAYSPPHSASVQLASVWGADQWVLAEAQFADLLPAVVLIDTASTAPHIVAHGVWSGYTKPWKAAPFIRTYLARQVPDVPGALVQCFEPQSPSFQ